MKNTVQLSVSSPCHEKWASFEPTANGGFCSSCQKTVTDFTKMSDDEIVRYFSHASSHTCGRFRPDQLKTYEEKMIAPIQPGFTLFKASALIVVMLLTAKQASSQPLANKAKTELRIDQRAEPETHSPASTHAIVRGVVKSKEDKSTLPGVNVVVKGQPRGTVTDADGRFELDNLEADDVLVFSFIGLHTKEYKIRDMKDGQVEIEMMLSMHVMGEVSVTGVYIAPPQGFSKLWSKVKGLF